MVLMSSKYKNNPIYIISSKHENGFSKHFQFFIIPNTAHPNDVQENI